MSGKNIEILNEYILLSVVRVKFVTGKIKTSIMIDADVWGEFKILASSKRGLKGVSEAVEEALEEELSERSVAEALAKMAGKKVRDLQVKPVKPKTVTSAGKTISEMRAKVA